MNEFLYHIIERTRIILYVWVDVTHGVPRVGTTTSKTFHLNTLSFVHIEMNMHRGLVYDCSLFDPNTCPLVPTCITSEDTHICDLLCLCSANTNVRISCHMLHVSRLSHKRVFRAF